jgi:hypothetical protein
MSLVDALIDFDEFDYINFGEKFLCSFCNSSNTGHCTFCKFCSDCGFAKMYKRTVQDVQLEHMRAKNRNHVCKDALYSKCPLCGSNDVDKVSNFYYCNLCYEWHMIKRS